VTGNEILIFGASRHAKVVADVARATGREVIGFLEDGTRRDGESFYGACVIAWDRFVADLALWPDVPVALGVGDNQGRAHVYERLQSLSRRSITLVHPSAVVSPTATIGDGVVILPMAVVNAQARVGIGVIVNSGVLADRDTVLGDFVHLSPRAAIGSGAKVGARVHVGMGAFVLPDIEVGDDAQVGAGAMVCEPVAPGTTVVGVPARLINRRSGSSGDSVRQF
jgi:sugar O-acyltransferase (sialic acid O-acetyltransferase NeuD family)